MVTRGSLTCRSGPDFWYHHGVDSPYFVEARRQKSDRVIGHSVEIARRAWIKAYGNVSLCWDDMPGVLLEDENSCNQ